MLSLVAYLALQHFSTLFHKGHDFRKKLLSMKCEFVFSLRLSKTFLIITRNEGNMTKMCIGLHVKYTLFYSDLMKFTRQIFKKYSNVKFHENPSSWSQVFPC